MSIPTTVVKEETLSEAIEKAREQLAKEGVRHRSSLGTTLRLFGAIITVPYQSEGEHWYPYWSKTDDEWYQHEFVAKREPIEAIKERKGLFSYRYADRSRFHDAGFGALAATVAITRHLSYIEIPLTSNAELTRFLAAAARHVHPQVILATIAWVGAVRLKEYTQSPERIFDHLALIRRDTLDIIVNELRLRPNSRQAITPSFLYPPIDFINWRVERNFIPPYQDFQLMITPEGLVSIHQHRSLDVKGGIQLDINHDRAWLTEASQALGVPPAKIVTIANDLHEYIDDGGGPHNSKHLTEKTTIRDWLFSVTDGYDPTTVDREAFLAKPRYQTMIEAVLSKTL
ncbi:MAG: hypothetical protein HY459_04945 [Parcubacteria group bacterium]|nr:hypothetical protein [Parcubacteria group bacterium]